MDKFPISLNNSNKKTVSGFAVNIVLMLLVLLIIFEIFFFVRYKRYYVKGDSMYPTLVGAARSDGKMPKAGGDYIYVDTYATPQRGDIVVITTVKKTTNVRTTIIKRLIAFGGEVIELREGELYINGERMYEPYLDDNYNDPQASINTLSPITVDEGCVFVLGDNRNSSNDSRSEDYGCVDYNRIVGVVPQWSLDMRWLITPISTFFDFTLPSAFSGCNS